MEVRIRTAVVESAAKKRGYTPEVYVSRLASISCGRKVCAHFVRSEDQGRVAVYRVA